MKKHLQYQSVLAAVIAAMCMPAGTAIAQDNEVIEEIVTTGTRSQKERTASDSTVPIDVISGEEFNALGSTADLTDNLRAAVPSFTATPATGDGSAFVRPTSLRGTAPDQTLVLVNGKRRHRSALVQFFAPAAGNGAHGVDIGMIPGIALKNVEVLRDGAAAQYGSDAIAGVINFIMKDASEGGQVQVQFGEHYEGEQSVKVAANIGLPAGDNGFINLSIEAVDNDALSRGIQRADAQALIDGGNTAVGQDAPFGDAPFVQTWGRPQTEGVRFFANAGFEVNDTAQLYARFGLSDTDGRYRFFYRSPTHSTFESQLAFGEGCPTCIPFDPNNPTLPVDTMSLREQGFVGLPGGFTPFLDGAQTDTSFVMGIDGEFDSGMYYDFSVGYGKSELDYFLNNTANPNLGPGDLQNLPQMDFDVGGYNQQEININADFALPLSDTVSLAFGAESREETFTAIAGEPSSYFLSGSSGFKGITPDNSGEFVRDNIAVYADVEWDVSDAVLLQFAGRYENFSDFGNTLNGKVAGRFRVNDNFALRGAISTGFHAPTPGQANVQTTITTFDGVTGLQVEEGLVPSTDPAVALVGGTALTEEESVNYSFGFTSTIADRVTLTADIYQIEVSDRIYRTGDIAVPSLPGLPARSISFYTNALDVEHQGLDLVANTSIEFGSNSTIDATLAYAYNKVEVTAQKQINGVNPVNDGLVEDIENNYPEHRWVLTGNWLLGEQFNFLARFNYYGEHFDERGRIGDPSDLSAQISSTIYLDIEAGWQLNDNWRVVLGAVNVTDEFIDEIGPPNANRLSVGLQYPRRTVANYEGGSWYLRATYNWQ